MNAWKEEKEEEGSILPLLLGVVALALALVYVCTCATDLRIAQKRLDGLADAAALAGADGFAIKREGDAVRAVLSDGGVREQALSVVAVRGEEIVVVEALAADGTSARVTLSVTWHPPLLGPFLPDGVPLTATATSRTALE